MFCFLSRTSREDKERKEPQFPFLLGLYYNAFALIANLVHSFLSMSPKTKKNPEKTHQENMVLLPFHLNSWVRSVSVLLVFLMIFHTPLKMSSAIRSFPNNGGWPTETEFGFTEAPEYRNGVECPVTSDETLTFCNPSLVHVAMTLDLEYLRGSMAAVHSVLRHASCPEHVFFHFVAAEFDPASPRVLTRIVRSVFPSLNFKVYIFREDSVVNLISSSIRSALENPLNYARNYLGDMIDPCVKRVIYLDSDVVVVDDVKKLWDVQLSESRVIGAPEYCHANFTKYFTDYFWSDPVLSRIFGSKNPCYFNTGVMVMDLVKWRGGNYRRKIENWMEVQKKKRIYELGSLPPFLLVFGGNVEPIDHRWNQHGLGGDNVKGSCRPLHPGPVSLLHWSGKGKPWARLDEKKPCPLDYLWEPHDLYKPNQQRRVKLHQQLQQGMNSIGYSNYLI